jgi:acetyltransferase-like isoleucine patch superfamily enzyme
MDKNNKKGSSWKLLYSRLQKERHLIIPGFIALANGYWHKIKFRLLSKDIKIGSAFRVYGKLIIRGSGKVRLGNNCYIDGLTFGSVCLSATLPDSFISVGANCGFNGTVIQCYRLVEIDDWSNISDAYITDTPAHSIKKNRREIPSKETPAFPVKIGKNVWISTRAVILHGVSIGDNSVIAACSLVRKNVPSDVLAAGNPLQIIKRIDV